MSGEPHGFCLLRAERQATEPVATHREIALPEDVHANQGVQSERVYKLESLDIIKDERKPGFSLSDRFSQTDAEQVAFRLPLALS